MESVWKFSPTVMKTERKVTHVTLKVQMQHENDIYFRIKRDMPLRRLKIVYCDRVGLEYDTIRFSYDGVKIGNNQTADELEMKDQDVIDAWNDQNGGGGGIGV